MSGYRQAYSANIHSRYSKSTLRGDMETIDRVLDYLVNTSDLALVLGGLGGVKPQVTLRLYSTYWSRLWCVPVTDREADCDRWLFGCGGVHRKSTIATINNDSNSNKTKHVKVWFNLIREQVLKMNIELHHVATIEMTSANLNKALDPKPFNHPCTKLLGMPTVLIRIAIQGMYRLCHSRQ